MNLRNTDQKKGFLTTDLVPLNTPTLSVHSDLVPETHSTAQGLKYWTHPLMQQPFCFQSLWSGVRPVVFLQFVCLRALSYNITLLHVTCLIELNPSSCPGCQLQPISARRMVQSCAIALLSPVVATMRSKQEGSILVQRPQA